MSPSDGPFDERGKDDRYKALAYDLLRLLYPHLCHIQTYFEKKLFWNSLEHENYLILRRVYRLLKDTEATNAQEESNL